MPIRSNSRDLGATTSRALRDQTLLMFAEGALVCMTMEASLQAQANIKASVPVVFGDLFLEDLRAYREAKLAEVGMKALFPLWGRDTAALARAMVDAGLRATLTCIDPRRLDRSFAGRTFDADLLRDFPADVDPCGENGEFHTFAQGGPMFRCGIPVHAGEVVERDGFVFADVLPLPFPESICHACAAPPKYVRTATSTFILCPLLPKKYPPQPVRSCPLFRPRERQSPPLGR